MVSPSTGAPEVVLAEDQPEYSPLSVALYRDHLDRMILLSRWRLSDQERARIAGGEDLYISLMTFDQPMQPISVQVGPDGWQLPSQPDGGGHT